MDSWIKKDPVNTYKSKLIQNNELDENELNENLRIISNEIDEAFKYAKESPFPDLSILDKHIYKD